MTSTNPTGLTQTLETEVTAVRRFVGLLEREQSMLIKGDIDGLLELVDEKNNVAAQLTTLARQRGERLADAGISADKRGMSVWLAEHPHEAGAHAQWGVLLSLATQARELNRLNGDLIRLRLQHNTQALEALLGAASAPLSLYDRDGHSAHVGIRRISDRA